MRVSKPVVLLVEDNATLRLTLRRYLDRRLQIRVFEATSAAEALNLVRRHQPEIVLLDLSLPDERGADMIPLIHSIRPDARVITMVSYLDRQHAETALLAGALECLPKESLGCDLEPVLWKYLAANQLDVSARVTQLRVGSVMQLAKRLVAGLNWIHRQLEWLDVNGPWPGRPRTRLLYVANLAGIALVVVLKQHGIGA